MSSDRKQNSSPAYEPWPRGWDGHWRQQVLTTAFEATAAQRLEWLEAMVDALTPRAEELLRNRERAGESSHAEHRTPA